MKEFNSKLNKHETVLLNLVANSLFNQNKNISFDNINKSFLWYEAKMQTVPLIALSKLDVGIFANPENVKDTLNQAFATNTKIDFEHTRIHKLMTQAKIPYTIIKGFACAAYYPDPLMRSMGDVDFLVNPSDVEKADEVLKNNGFELVKDSHDCHMVYTANGCRYEMHFEPAGIPRGKTGGIIREYLSDAVSGAREINTELGAINVPSPFHHGLIILLHMCHHLTGEGIGLRHLCDWAMFVSSITNEEFCKLFEEKLKNIGLWRFACILTQLCSEYLGCPPKNWVGKSEPQLTRQIISDIFRGGNFGQKSPDRSHESLLLSAKNEESIENTSMLKQFFASANSIVYSNWKIAKKLKILLPLGWLFYGGRYLMRSFFGKRPKVRLKKVAKEATERKNIYAHLNLFETRK